MRQSLAAAAICIGLLRAVLLAQSAPATSDVGKRWPSERYTIVDRITGVPITVWTSGPSTNSHNYQTDPQWTSDGEYIIMHSNRAAGGSTQTFAISERTGEIIQLTDSGGGGSMLARKSNKMYFFRGGRGGPAQLIEQNLDPLLADSKAGTMKPPAAYERVVFTMPSDLRPGGLTLDADEKVAYLGVSKPRPPGEQRPPAPPVRQAPPGPGGQPGPPPRPVFVPDPNPWSGLRKVDLQTGAVSKIIDVDLQIGHIQANPFVSGEIMYCHETGGDAPQRMWLVNADGTGNRPLYKETPDEWVTHEAWVDKDLVYFVIMGFLPRLRLHPTGIASINVRNDATQILGQIERGGFSHCNGSRDGRWAVGDSGPGNIHLIDLRTGEVILLSTNHVMRPDHAHPTFHPNGREILIQSGLISGGMKLDIMTIGIPEWMQNRR